MNEKPASKELEAKGGCGVSRRAFLGTAGAGVAAGLLAPAASKKRDPHPERRGGGGTARGRRWGFLIDLRRCVGCHACTVACKTENGVPLGGFRSVVKEYETGVFPDVRRVFLPTLCNHCDQPPCLEPCPTEVIQHEWIRPDGKTETFTGKAATFKRPDGLVLVDPDRCWGCSRCVNACPYDARFNRAGRKAGAGPGAGWIDAIDKCDLCVHRLEAGLVPSCVNTCQGGARLAGDLNDPDSTISKTLEANKDDVKVLLEGRGTHPSCFYIGAKELGIEIDEVFEKGKDVRKECRSSRLTPLERIRRQGR